VVNDRHMAPTAAARLLTELQRNTRIRQKLGRTITYACPIGSAVIRTVQGVAASLLVIG
jgi:hypothetical protein